MTVTSSLLPLCRAMSTSSLHAVAGLVETASTASWLLTLPPEPVRRDDQELAPGDEGHPGDSRLGDDPPLQRAVAERTRHHEAALHPPPWLT